MPEVPNRAPSNMSRLMDIAYQAASLGKGKKGDSFTIPTINFEGSEVDIVLKESSFDRPGDGPSSGEITIRKGNRAYVLSCNPSGGTLEISVDGTKTALNTTDDAEMKSLERLVEFSERALQSLIAHRAIGKEQAAEKERERVLTALKEF